MRQFISQALRIKSSAGKFYFRIKIYIHFCCQSQELREKAAQLLTSSHNLRFGGSNPILDKANDAQKKLGKALHLKERVGLLPK